jgi:hypothetical protein
MSAPRARRGLDITKSNLWTLEDGWPVKLFEHYDLDRFRRLTG